MQASPAAAPGDVFLDADFRQRTVEFSRGFVGMTREPVALEALLATRESLLSEILGAMPDTHRAFLLAFERGAPTWEALGLEAATALPVVQWRQQNLARISQAKRSALVHQLEQVLLP